MEPAPVSRPLRALLIVQIVAVAIAGLQLFVLSERTGDFFAWTINPPVTAAFLGASYWGSLVLLVFAVTRQRWRDARIAIAGVFVFTCLTTLATLQHREAFHFEEGGLAGMAAWAWLVVYVVFPFATVAAVAWQVRQHGLDLAPAAAVNRPYLHLAYVAIAAALLIIGGMLWTGTGVDDLWPWALSPLTSKAVAAWWIGIALQLLHAAFEGEPRRSLAMSIALPVWTALALAAVLRYSADVAFLSTAGVLYLGALAALFAGGVAGIAAARQTRLEIT